MAQTDVAVPGPEDDPPQPTEDVGTNTETPLPAAVPVPAKRGRGRPPKNPLDPKLPKRGPGRPRKHPEAPPKDPNAPKRGRGRPRKNPAEPAKPPSASGEPAKPGRGRRKKVEAPSRPSDPTPQPGGEPSVPPAQPPAEAGGKKKRGRPPKAQEGEGAGGIKKAKVIETKVSDPKKGRRRPKKTAAKDSEAGSEELRLNLSESPGSDPASATAAAASSKLKRNGVLQTKPVDQPQQESSDSSYATP